MIDKATYYLTPNAAGTSFTGTGYTPDGTIPANAIPCTQEQAQNFQAYAPSNGEIVSAPSAVLLAQAQTAQKALVTQGYNTAIIAPISFTDTAGVADTYQADSTSQQYLARAVTGYRIAGGVPAGFYWRSATNQNNAFTLADLEGLYTAILARAEEDYQQLQTLKAQINAATTASAVAAIVWP